MSHTGTFKGRGQFHGWVFDLLQMTHANGSPGYVRRTIKPCPEFVGALTRSAEANEKLAPEYAAALREEAAHPTPDWVEEAWPVEWLRHGLIVRVEK